ncbi:hypothetical protein P0D88_34315 [Paraburkholderia sp. RL18-103-BIB-C]|jgi:hypothetical protein|uniref:hypothetical protein n=1 Tax=Paraburkholderia sp. RL18-103-BIB-C TaxID=3031637 RepID=UPI0038B87773
MHHIDDICSCFTSTNTAATSIFQTYLPKYFAGMVEYPGPEWVICYPLVASQLFLLRRALKSRSA